MKLTEAACRSLKSVAVIFQNNKFNIIIQFVLHSSLKKIEFDDDLEKPGEQTACKIVKGRY